jgi:hypothetical protein
MINIDRDMSLGVWLNEGTHTARAGEIHRDILIWTGSLECSYMKVR